MKTEIGQHKKETTVEQLAQQIFASGQITRADENLLHQITMSEIILSREDLNQIRRVMERLQMGLLRLVE
jgi:hypothetical protein